METMSSQRESYLYDIVLARIDVEAKGGVVRVSDGVDTWFAWEREWDAMIDRVRSGELRLSDDPAAAYSQACHAVRGPVLSRIASNSGTPDEIRKLASAAVGAWDIDPEQYGVAID